MPISLPMIGDGDASLIDNKTILTATGGFLDGGFTHTINLAAGCPYGSSLCGVYCYAQHNHWITQGRPWGLYGFKKNVIELYRSEYEALKQPRRGAPKPLSIFMSSSTDPYPPQRVGRQFTRALLQEMLNRPPDSLVIQTRSPFVASDLELITALAGRAELWVSMTVETDMERIPGLPNHATPLPKRIAALKVFRERRVQTQAAVSPLLPLTDPVRFARTLSECCNRVILDHYLLGDGSAGGLRTRRTRFPEMLESAGLGEWNTLEKFWATKAVFDRILGPGRVLVSAEGFNAVGTSGPKEDTHTTAATSVTAGSAGSGTPAPCESEVVVGNQPDLHDDEATDGPPSGRSSVSELRLEYITDNKAALIEKLRRRLGVVRDAVRAVARDYATGLYLFGRPGTAKTHTVRSYLETQIKEPYVYKRGHITPLGLFEHLDQNPDVVSVLDDVGNILKSPVALQILLAALEHPSPRDRTRTRVVTYQRQGVTKSTRFRGGIIMISNLELHSKDLLEAFKSRIKVLNYNPDDAMLGALMLGVAEMGWPVEDPSVSRDECVEVARFLIEEMLRLNCRFDLRLFFTKALQDFQQWKDDESESHWRDLVTSDIEEHLVELRHEAETAALRAARKEREHAIVREILRHFATREDRVSEWKNRTGGKSERAFYRRLAEIDRP